VTATALAVADCERIHDGFLGQPVNAVSSLAYLVSGGALMLRARRAPRGEQAWLLAFGGVTASNALGGLAYHGPGGASGRWLHDAALLATLGLVTVADVEVLVDGRRWQPRALAVVAASALVALWPTASTPAQVALAASAVVAEGLVSVRRRSRRAGRRPPLPVVAVTGALAASVYLTSRTGRPLCRPDSLVQGHAVWHVLTALLLWWWGRAAAEVAPRR
jgi:hypothetical protein